MIPSGKQAVNRAAELLAGLLEIGNPEVRFPTGSKEGKVDGIARIGPWTFVIRWKSSAGAAPVTNEVNLLKRLARPGSGKEVLPRGGKDVLPRGAKSIPLLVVPYMGPLGRRICEESGTSWVDLSGNARVLARGLRIIVDGRPNRFKRRGRPASPFAPKSSRIARWLLVHKDTAVTQREIARATDMDEGFVSRIAARLEEEGYVVRNETGGLRVRDPDVLLDAWRDAYDFERHTVLRGHVAARSGEELLQRTSRVAASVRVEHAFTGLGAAWLYTRFADFRIVTCYLAEPPSEPLIESMGFRREARGANLWLVAPKDAGVFHGAAEVRGIPCAHPVQVYLDLKGHPERADEAASSLRRELLGWGDENRRRNG